MKKTTKAVTVGLGTGLSTPGMVATIDYLWQFTNLPALPPETTLMVAGILATLIYAILPHSTPPEPKP